MMTSKRQSVAAIGAGIAAATIVRALGLAGQMGHVFDKSRGLGGRLATRRVEWVDRQGLAATTRLDRGALGFTASSAAFQTFANLALQAGWLAEWNHRFGGPLPRGWVSAETSSAAAVSKEPGCLPNPLSAVLLHRACDAADATIACASAERPMKRTTTRVGASPLDPLVPFPSPPN